MIEEFQHDQLSSFAGLPVCDFTVGRREDLEVGAIPDDIEARAWRVGIEAYDDPGFADTFAIFLEAVDTTRIKALILGNWWGDGDPGHFAEQATALLIENADRFPAVEALFLGDIHAEQAEVSWIVQGDPAAVLAAFPRLRQFGLRGTSSLTLAPFSHGFLEEVTFQGGGFPPAAAQAIAQSSLPVLTGIDLYLGTPTYGGGATAEDLGRILAAESFPALRHLGLRNAENADEIAAALAHAPVVRLESLDLSLGNLSDEGAAALLAGQPLTHLAALDLHHHFLSDEMMQRVRNALPGVEVKLDEQEVPDVVDDDGFRYIAVAE
jgi:hypothetical protein